MNTVSILSDADIKKARADNPKLRERDLATNLGISEARLIHAFQGESARRLRADVDAIISGLSGVGEVMALTRNACAVHEKTGPYENARLGGHVAVVLGAHIDLRILRSHWVHAFAVEKKVGDSTLSSIQIFDAHGDAVHKVFTRQHTDMAGWSDLVDALAADAPHGPINAAPRTAPQPPRLGEDDIAKLRADWAAMTDMHQVAGLLRGSGLSKGALIRHLAPQFASRLMDDAIESLLRIAANESLPIMVFVRNPGCLQVHSGPISALKKVGPWFNVMDPGFHLHLRTDKIASVWAVRKPSADGAVMSIEAFADDGSPIIMINGVSADDDQTGSEWRILVEGLPRMHFNRSDR
ncbi:MAG: hemin-degrading factor [Phyllobacteriaceae bacterium]|nr:hemin-degrading factor [Phyllobacteriaceae bacterium]